MDRKLFNVLRQSIKENEEFEQPKNEEVAQPEEANLKPEITDELVSELLEKLNVSDVDKEEFKKGLQVELEHWDTVGQDIEKVAQIALDHIKETPAGESYYDALSQMEHELKETPAEEKVEPEVPVAPEAPVEEKPVSMEESKLKENQGTSKEANLKPVFLRDLNKAMQAEFSAEVKALTRGEKDWDLNLKLGVKDIVVGYFIKPIKIYEGKIPAKPAAYDASQIKALFENSVALEHLKTSIESVIKNLSGKKTITVSEIYNELEKADLAAGLVADVVEQELTSAGVEVLDESKKKGEIKTKNPGKVEEVK